MLAVNHDLDMQVVVLQQDGTGCIHIAAVSRELFGICQAGIASVRAPRFEFAVVNEVQGGVTVGKPIKWNRPV